MYDIKQEIVIANTVPNISTNSKKKSSIIPEQKWKPIVVGAYDDNNNQSKNCKISIKMSIILIKIVRI